MRAAVHSRYGPPEVAAVKDVDKPTADAGEILIRVRATTVNRTDCATRAAKPFFARLITGLIKPKAKVLGNEFAGVVEAIGSDVDSFRVGDRVFGYNEGPFGAHAEYMTIPADSAVATMATNATFEQAAASTEGSHYALTMIEGAKICDGRDVLVNGATGGIGSAAVQLAKSLGANVVAVCGTENLALVESLGADRVIDYTAVDFTKDDQSFDTVLDTVGKSTFGRCRRLLKPGGSYVSSDLGPLVQNPFLALITPLFRGRRVLFPIPHHDQEMIEFMRELTETDQFAPVIDRTYRLDQIVEAYRYVETGKKIGNVIIAIDDDDREDQAREPTSSSSR